MDLTVKPPKEMKHYKQKQPPYEHMEGWLASRAILSIPSGGGKQIVMLNLALKFTFLFLNLAKIKIVLPKSACGEGGIGLGIIPKKTVFSVLP